jgi:hypothetical protein
MRLVGPICFQSWNGAKDGVAALEDAGFGVELFLDMVETFSHVTYGAVFIDAAADADENKLWSRIRALIDPHGGLVDEFGPLGPGESLRDLWKNLPPLVKRQ